MISMNQNTKQDRSIFRNDGINSTEMVLNYVYSIPLSTAIVETSTLLELEEKV